MAGRVEYVKGLRALADLLEQHEDVPLPYDGDVAEISIYAYGAPDQKDAAQAFTRAFPGRLDKRTNDYSAGLHLVGKLHGLRVQFVVAREVVCERKVVGTRKVTKQVPVQYETREVDEDVVEWDCGSLLRPAVEEDRSGRRDVFPPDTEVDVAQSVMLVAERRPALHTVDGGDDRG